MSSAELEALDRILDELDELATSDAPAEQFLATVLSRVRLVLQAPYATVLIPAGNEGDSQVRHWFTVSECGEPPSQLPPIQDELSRVNLNLGQKGYLNVAGWTVVGVRSGHLNKGALCVASNDVLAEGIAEHEIVEILNAFAEIILTKQRCDLERFLDNEWPQVQNLQGQIAASADLPTANKTLVNCLAQTLGVLRVSLVSKSTWAKPQLVAVSGSPSVDSTSPIAAEFVSTSSDAFRTEKLQVTSPAGSKGSANLPASANRDLTHPSATTLDLSNSVSPFQIAIPLKRHASGDDELLLSPVRDVLTLEFASREELTSKLASVQQVVNSIECIWDRQRDWLKLPAVLRSGARRTANPLSYLKGAAKYAVGIALVGIIAWLCFRPIPLRVEAKGVFEPQIERTVFATNDGILAKLNVQEGDKVRAGETLAQIQSPELELAHKELRGEIASIREESASLQIAINQLDSRDSDLVRSQISMAAKIKELQTKERSFLEQLSILEKQRANLTIVAPITGTVVGKDIAQQLAARPVTRGVPLFKIVDMDGPWQLRMQVADRDTWYAFEAANAAERGIKNDPEVEFSFDRNPKEKYRAVVVRRAQRVENLHGEGSYTEVLAKAPAIETETSYSGTGIHAYFDCGSYSAWFVWGRPFIEAMQRRFWLGSDPDSATVSKTDMKVPAR